MITAKSLLIILCTAAATAAGPALAQEAGRRQHHVHP